MFRLACCPILLILLLGCHDEEPSSPLLQGPPVVGTERRITFSSTRDGNLEIYSMNVDGSDQARLTSHTGADHNADWSPDGNRIAFMGHRDGDYELYVMNEIGRESC